MTRYIGMMKQRFHMLWCDFLPTEGDLVMPSFFFLLSPCMPSSDLCWCIIHLPVLICLFCLCRGLKPIFHLKRDERVFRISCVLCECPLDQYRRRLEKHYLFFECVRIFQNECFALLTVTVTWNGKYRSTWYTAKFFLELLAYHNYLRRNQIDFLEVPPHHSELCVPYSGGARRGSPSPRLGLGKKR